MMRLWVLQYDVEDIPADLADEAAEWREKLLEVQLTTMMS